METNQVSKNSINDSNEEVDVTDSLEEQNRSFNNSNPVQEFDNRPPFQNDTPDGEEVMENQTQLFKMGDDAESLELQYTDRPYEIFEDQKIDKGDVDEEEEENALCYNIKTSSIEPTPVLNTDADLLALSLSLDLTPTPVQGDIWNDLYGIRKIFLADRVWRPIWIYVWESG